MDDAKLDDLQKRVEEATEDGGFWKSCSGCHDTNEGVPMGPYSAALKCFLGVGCHECGGLGAIWDNTDYSDAGSMLDYTPDVAATDPHRPAEMEALKAGAVRIDREAAARAIHDGPLCADEMFNPASDSGQWCLEVVDTVIHAIETDSAALNRVRADVMLEAAQMFDNDMNLSNRICCNGEMCGCQGATALEYVHYQLRARAAEVEEGSSTSHHSRDGDGDAFAAAAAYRSARSSVRHGREDREGRRVMAKIVIEKWKCDRCGVVHDEKPKLSYPRASARLVLTDEWFEDIVSWTDVCEECSAEIREALAMLRKGAKRG